MKMTSILLTSLALVALPVWGADVEAASAKTEAAAPHQERAYRSAIEQLESSEGAYAEGLSESLLSLARTLQSQGRHEEAIKLFRRGVHLTRINEGLYCPQQIPLLQGEIASGLAVKNYTLADERQNYLFRVQMRSLEGSDSLAGAFMQQAKWQYDAYQLGLGPEGYSRLMAMADLYRQAAQDVIEREGETSPELLPPLHGMLQAQYLISGYEWQESDQVFTEDGRIAEPLLWFKSYRARSYEQGNAIIDTISKIEQGHPGDDNSALAPTQVMLGDWHLWNGRTEAAWQAYREAQAELARRGAAQAQTEQLFAEPVPLPDFAELNPLPPAVEPEQADVTLAFGVSDRGRVQDVERLDNNEEAGRQASRLMRQLRKTTFRPRFEAGQPVETEHLVKAFNIP